MTTAAMLKTDPSEARLKEIAAIAEDAYIYGLPIVVNYATMFTFTDPGDPQYCAPFNTLINDHQVFTPDNKVVVTPNSDTPYSKVWLDLRAQPMVISVPDVEEVQAGYKVQPLSAFLGQPAPAPAPSIDFLPASTENLGNPETFYQCLDAALAFVPVDDYCKDIRKAMVSIGIGSGSFDFDSLPRDEQTAFMDGMSQGNEEVDNYPDRAGIVPVNGWSIGSAFGDGAFFNGDWLKRAYGTKAGIYGNDTAEAVYPSMRTCGDEVLDGSKHNYVMTFEMDQLPPVNAFWSVTMYDGNTQFLVDNPIDRYLINSSMVEGMKTNGNSLPIYIQYSHPGLDKETNWLPAPDGPIYLVMRLYWPKDGTEASSILPVGDGSWNPPPVMQVS
ncbi:DUF1254 domain-containing protein [Thiothrix nivea]|uniref:DUF1254 domain-containing protein n=1 Tax=Thiothrix nivea (strain ATCC 35100 / DSM 5205 / JP2) TaxID=870187 RepID=A0A656HGE5_THINJ|nr:DUF1214 domain-containing protein [Thiothrix nivea]EIJ35084.1 protein of unknown function DUF1214 [Thiothrix nivea DSM 5205]